MLTDIESEQPEILTTPHIIRDESITGRRKRVQPEPTNLSYTSASPYCGVECGLWVVSLTFVYILDWRISGNGNPHIDLIGPV